jgi:tetratricopeptide (TPR) repeat protein
MTGPASARRLVGRDRELAAGFELIADAASGRGRAMLIEGEPGIGKTALVRALTAGHNFVLRATGTELARDRPLGVLVNALGLHGRRASKDSGPIATVLANSLHGPNRGDALIDAFVDHIERLALVRPVVLALDDLHWADTTSVVALGALVDRLALMPVAVLLATRSHPRRPDISTLAAEIAIDGVHVHLGSLDRAEVDRLVADLVGREPDPRLAAAVDAAGGNPLFVTELVASVTSSPSSVALPSDLRHTILRSIASLGSDTIELLQIATILGESFRVDDLASVTHRSVVELLGALRDACDSGVLVSDDDRLSFRHALVRDAAYEDTPLAVRKALHLEAGRALARRGAPTTEVAAQLALGAAPGDPDAIDWLRKAAAEALAIAPETAAELLGRCLDLMVGDHPDRGPATVDLAVAWSLAGHPQQSEAAALDALALDLAPSDHSRTRFLYATTLNQLGRPADAMAQLDELARTPDLPIIVLGRISSTRASSLLRAGAVDAALEEADAAVRLAEAHGLTVPLVHGCMTMALAHRARGDLPQSIAWCRRAVPDDQPTDAMASIPDFRVHVYQTLATALCDSDRDDEAEAASRAAARFSAVRHSVPSWHAERANRHFRRGEWDDCVAEAEAGLGASRGVDPSGRGLLCATLVRVALHRDDAALATVAFATLDQLMDAVPHAEDAVTIWARGVQAVLAGDQELASARFARAWSRCARGGIALQTWIGPDHLERQLADGTILH